MSATSSTEPSRLAHDADADSLLASVSRPATATVYLAPSLSGTVTAQPSKNYTSRYLLAAALAHGTSTLRNCATSDDARAMQRCLRGMGARVDVTAAADGEGEAVTITGVGGRPYLADAAEPLNVGNAGAVLRLLLGVGALLPEITFVTDHPQSLGKRPNQDLLDALQQLGCDAEAQAGTLPITLRGGRLHGGRITVSGARSSQFLSGLLFLAPLVGEPVEIEVVNGLVSKAPVRQTLEVLAQAGIHVDAAADLLHFRIQPQQYQPIDIAVNGDWPGSAALLAAAAVTNSALTVAGLYQDEQGEKESATVLRDMGAQLNQLPGGGVATAVGNGELRAVDFDGDLATDAVLALLAPACFAQGRSRFYNVSNLRIKECDRITEPLQELRKLGVRCWEGNEVGDSDPDAILIEGNPAGYDGGVEVDGRGDHRVIMLLSIVALRCKSPVRIRGAHQVAKSYPAYFRHLTSLGARVELETN